MKRLHISFDMVAINFDNTTQPGEKGIDGIVDMFLGQTFPFQHNCFLQGFDVGDYSATVDIGLQDAPNGKIHGI